LPLSLNLSVTIAFFIIKSIGEQMFVYGNGSYAPTGACPQLSTTEAITTTTTLGGD
jgi:hypothetical protein